MSLSSRFVLVPKVDLDSSLDFTLCRLLAKLLSTFLFDFSIKSSLAGDLDFHLLWMMNGKDDSL